MSQLIKNKGNAHINTAISQYHFYSEIFDPYVLNIHTYFRNDGDVSCSGTLYIVNSYIFGTSFNSIILGGGETFIENTEINHCRMAIAAWPDSVFVSIDNVQFIDVGHLYHGLMALVISDELGPPVFITAQDSIIKNSHFVFYDPWGFIVTSTEIFSLVLFGSLDDYSKTKYKMTLINNTFELNANNSEYDMDTIRLVISPNVTSHFSLNFAGQSAIESFLSLYTASGLFYLDSLLTFHTNSLLEAIGNTFYGSFLQNSFNIAFIGIYNEEVNCMSGNTIFGFALYLSSGGIVTSCYRRDLVNIINDSLNCWNGGLGPLNNIYSDSFDVMDHFVALETNIQNYIPLIFIESAQSIFAAQNITFSRNDTKTITYNLLNLNVGNIVMFDVLLDTNMDISYGNNCNISCYELQKQIEIESDTISIYEIEAGCTNNSIYVNTNRSRSLLNTQFTLSNHASAFWIDLFYNHQYFPGGKFFIESYSVMDIFDNEISNYSKIIQIQLLESALSINLNITIDANGNCLKCDQGIYFQTINMNDVGRNTTITTSITNNELHINDIQITIVPCPAMLGKSGAAVQCELCTVGYFSLHDTINECVSCYDIIGFDPYVITCPGENIIIVRYNYWMSLIETKNNTYSMKSSLCPPNQCCQNTKGCDYLELNLCQKGRDPTSYLCSECLNEFTEKFATTKCGKCSRDYIERLLYPLLIAVIITIFFIFSTSKANNEKKANKKSYIPSGFISVQKIIILKPICYYFQTVSYIIAHTEGVTISVYLSSIVELFNVSIDATSSGESDGFCFLKSMNS
eukprot:186191_1